MNQDLYALEDIFIRLQGTQVVDYSYSLNTLRLQIKTPVASQLLSLSDTIHLVLKGCHELFYLSYTQPQESRSPLYDSNSIFEIGLQIQGMELKNRETLDKQTNQKFIIYTNSYLHTIEAGELHLTASNFNLYDEEYGQINFDDFKRAANKLKADL